MNFYIKQKIFSWGDKFSIYDVNGNVRFYVEGEVFTFGKKLHLFDLQGNELAYIEQQLLTFRPKYLVYVNGEVIAEVVKEITFFHPKYSVDGLGWLVEGDFWDHSYNILENDQVVAAVHKEWFTLGDAYEITTSESQDLIATLAVVLVIDACIEAQRNN